MAENTVSAAPPERDRKVILIVDDKSMNRKVIQMAFRNKDYEILEAADGAEAVEVAREKRPDLILMDIMMPIQDGYECTRQLKSEEELTDIPILFVSSREKPDDIVRAFEAGGSDYIKKPFVSSELLARVDRQLQGKSRADELARREAQVIHVMDEQHRMFSTIAYNLSEHIKELARWQKNLREKLEQTGATQLAEACAQKQEEILNMLTNLENWSAAQLGDVEIKRTTFPLREAVEEIVQVFTGFCEEKKTKIQNKVPDKMTAYCDPQMFTTIMHNLVTNAIRFSPRKGTIQISAEGDGFTAKIHIKDMGVGMSAALLGKIFSKHELTPTPDADDVMSNGIGLKLCHRLIEINRGKISAESEPGKGTTFHIMLPQTLNEEHFEDTEE